MVLNHLLLMHNNVWMWKFPTTVWIILIWTIHFFSFKFVQCRFHFWWLMEKYSLSPSLWKWYPIVNETFSNVIYTQFFKKIKLKHTYFGESMFYNIIKTWYIKFGSPFTKWKMTPLWFWLNEQDSIFFEIEN